MSDEYIVIGDGVEHDRYGDGEVIDVRFLPDERYVLVEFGKRTTECVPVSTVDLLDRKLRIDHINNTEHGRVALGKPRV